MSSTCSYIVRILSYSESSAKILVAIVDFFFTAFILRLLLNRSSFCVFSKTYIC